MHHLYKCDVYYENNSDEKIHSHLSNGGHSAIFSESTRNRNKPKEVLRSRNQFLSVIYKKSL